MQFQRVVTAPPKPVMIFDGDCRFCRAWIARWQQTTGDALEYLPLQDPSVPERFPEISRRRLEEAVHLIDTAGNVYAAADAVLRSLAIGRGSSTLRWAYQHVSAFRWAAESTYRWIARHRGIAWGLTRLLWGESVVRCEYYVTQWLILRLFGLIYLCAFVSLWTQIDGLIGSNGILPVARWAESVRAGLDGYWFWYPSLIWFSTSDACLHALCAGGVIAALLVTLNVAPAPALLAAWVAYQSLYIAGQVFLGYQWDALLLEAGFAAIFLAPWCLWPRRMGIGHQWATNQPEPSRVMIWLLRFLLFRLMFQSGCAKLLSGDPTWWGLTALQFHYETQPLPTWIGWWAHQLPASVQSASVVGMFIIELAVPFLIFLPRRARFHAFMWLTLLQILIALTGNYCFFNWIALTLCLVLLDDATILRVLRISDSRFSIEKRFAAEPANSTGTRRSRLQSGAIAVFACFVVVVGCTQLTEKVMKCRVGGPLGTLNSLARTSNTVNTYGLFAVMTTSRDEIVIQGSDDGVTWLDYEFKYKPGDLARPPAFVAPHQPRLDWQMWFAALGNYRQNPWLLNFMVRLLQGSPSVLKLMATNPFPDAPPLYVRAIVYDYHFTDREIRMSSGAWWRREFLGPYCPVLTLRPVEEVE